MIEISTKKLYNEMVGKTIKSVEIIESERFSIKINTNDGFAYTLSTTPYTEATSSGEKYTVLVEIIRGKYKDSSLIYRRIK